MKIQYRIFFLLFVRVTAAFNFESAWPWEEDHDVSSDNCCNIRDRDVDISNDKSFPIKIKDFVGLDISLENDFYVRDDEFVDTSNDKFFSIKIDALAGYLILSFNLGGTIDKYYLGRSF